MKTEGRLKPREKCISRARKVAQQAQALTCCACLKLSPLPRPHSGRNNQLLKVAL